MQTDDVHATVTRGQLLLNLLWTQRFLALVASALPDQRGIQGRVETVSEDLLKAFDGDRQTSQIFRYGFLVDEALTDI